MFILSENIAKVLDVALDFTQFTIFVFAIYYTHAYLSAVGLRMSYKTAEQKKLEEEKRNKDKVIYVDFKAKERLDLKVYHPGFGGIDLRWPNFNGTDNQVLGIRDDAPTKIIVLAYRHWLGEFHPDKNTNLSETEKHICLTNCQKINSAKINMLEKRQKRKIA